MKRYTFYIFFGSLVQRLTTHQKLFPVKLLIVAVIIISFGSCRGFRLMPGHDRLAPISEQRLFEMVEASEVKFNSLFFRRLVVSVEGSGFSRSFRSNMYIRQDSNIVISVVPVLGIELYRILLNGEGVIVVDRINRRVLKGSFNSLISEFNIPLNYLMIQDILTNSLSPQPYSDLPRHSRYRVFVSDSSYHLKSNDTRLAAREFHHLDFPLVHQLDISPSNFKINRSVFTQPGANRVLAIDYDGFEIIGERYYFPSRVRISANSGAEVFFLEFRYTDVELNGNQTISFRIPDNYEVVDL